MTELLGSLLDDVRKWARGKVGPRAEGREGTVVIVIEDGGPDIPSHDRRAVLLRDTRIDPGASGTGLGLSIAEDIAASYGGVLRLGDAELGGLSVRVEFPVRARIATVQPRAP